MVNHEALHCTLSADLSTDAFLLRVRNFINRCGMSIKVRSDFVGATKKIKEVINGLDHKRIRSELS